MNDIKTIKKSCRYCGAQHSVSVPVLDYQKWLNGALIQNALPLLSIEDREFLISGSCPKCQEILFRVEPGDDEDYVNEYDDEDFDYNNN